jgi:hypothetical protein
MGCEASLSTFSDAPALTSGSRLHSNQALTTCDLGIFSALLGSQVVSQSRVDGVTQGQPNHFLASAPLGTLPMTAEFELPLTL